MATRLIFFYRFCTESSIKFAIDANFFGDRRIIGRNRFQKCFNLYECKKMLQDFNTNWYLHMHPAPSVLISLLNPKKSIKNNIFWTLIFNDVERVFFAIQNYLTHIYEHLSLFIISCTFSNYSRSS